MTAQFFYVSVQIIRWTFIMKYFRPRKLLLVLSILGRILTIGVFTLQDIRGTYCLVVVSSFMSLMFPTIYGIALQGLGDDAKFAAAGLITAILCGSITTPLQMMIIDSGSIIDMLAVNVSFALPLLCFVVIAVFGCISYEVFNE